MSDLLQRAAGLLGFRQKSYQQAFSGSAMQLVLVDLAKFSRAFDPDLDGATHDVLLTMHGRRQMFFRIIKHLNLTPAQLEAVYQPALVQAAKRIQTNYGDDNE